VQPPVTPQRRTSVVLLVVVVVLVLTGGWSLYRLVRMWWADAQLAAARQALERGDFQAAKDHLHFSLSLRADNPDVYILLGQTARRAGQETEALDYYRHYEELGGVEELARLERMLLRAQKGDLAEVEGKLWAFVDNQAPDSPLILEALAQGSMRTFRLGQALKYLDRWLQEQPVQPKALLWKGEALIRLQRKTEALETYKQLVQAVPENEEGRLALGTTLVEESHYEEALEQFEFVLKHKPTSPLAPQASVGRAECLLALGHAEDAGAALDAVLATQVTPGPEFLLLRGKVEIARDQPQKAEPWLRRAVEAAPYERKAVYSLARCLRSLNKLAEAESLQTRAKRLDSELEQLNGVTRRILESPHDASLRCQAGAIFLRVGNDKEGLRWLETALKEDPYHPETHRTLAEYFRAHGRPDLAANHEQFLPNKR